MQKLLQFKDRSVYKKADGDIITASGQVLNSVRYARNKCWLAPDRTMVYEENEEKENHFLYQRLLFANEDGKTYSSFGLSMQGPGNIPWRYAVGIYEKTDAVPMILRTVRPTWGSRLDDEDNDYPIERGESHLYVTDWDKQNRAKRVTVISRERINKVSYNAFDLKITYEGLTIKPKEVRMLDPNWVVVGRKVPEAHGTNGREINETTHAVLARFGIDSQQIIRSKTFMKSQARSGR